jgi:hypothetical protein
MSVAGPRPPWIREQNRLLASLPRGANYSHSGGSVAAELANEGASVGAQ